MQNKKDNLYIFWNCFKFIGIDIEVRKSKSKIFFVFLNGFISAIFLIYSVFDIFMTVKKLIERPMKFYYASRLISHVATLLMYFTLLTSRSKLKVLRKVLSFIKAGSKTDRVYVFMYVIILISLAFPLIFLTVHFHQGTGGLDDHSFFGNRQIRIIFFLIKEFVACFVEYTFPIMMNCFFCAVCHQWKLVIVSVTDQVQRCGRRIFFDRYETDITSSLLEKCRFIWHGTKQIKQAFSSFLFHLILMQVMGIFLSLSAIIKFELEDWISGIIFIEVAFMFSFTSTVYLASKVPEKMEELITILEEMNEDVAFSYGDVKLGSLQRRLKMILKKKPIALSVGGLANMNRNFIGTTFGAMVSYGLIAIQNW